MTIYAYDIVRKTKQGLDEGARGGYNAIDNSDLEVPFVRETSLENVSPELPSRYEISRATQETKLPPASRIKQRGRILEVKENGDAICSIIIKNEFEIKTIIPADLFYSVQPEPLMEFWWYPETDHLTIMEFESNSDLDMEIEDLEKRINSYK